LSVEIVPSHEAFLPFKYLSESIGIV